MDSLDKSIIITAHVTYDVYRRFYMFSLYKGRLYKLGPTLFFGIAAIGIAISLFSGFAFGFDSTIVTLLIILCITTLLMLFLIFITPRMYYKSAGKLIEIPTKYTFFDAFISVESESETANSTSQISYKAIHKIYETDDMLYIFLSSTQAYIIPKNECSYEDMQFLRMMFSEHGVKYKNYSKKS